MGISLLPRNSVQHLSVRICAAPREVRIKNLKLVCQHPWITRWFLRVHNQNKTDLQSKALTPGVVPSNVSLLSTPDEQVMAVLGLRAPTDPYQVVRTLKFCSRNKYFGDRGRWNSLLGTTPQQWARRKLVNQPQLLFCCHHPGSAEDYPVIQAIVFQPSSPPGADTSRSFRPL